MKLNLDKKVSLGWVAIAGIGCLALGFGISDMGAKIFKFEWEWETVLAGALGLAGGWLAYIGAMTPHRIATQKRVLEFQHQLSRMKRVLQPVRVTEDGYCRMTEDGHRRGVDTKPPSPEAIYSALPIVPYDLGDPKLLSMYDRLRIVLPGQHETINDMNIRHAVEAIDAILDYIERNFKRHN